MGSRTTSVGVDLFGADGPALSHHRCQSRLAVAGASPRLCSAPATSLFTALAAMDLEVSVKGLDVVYPYFVTGTD